MQLKLLFTGQGPLLSPLGQGAAARAACWFRGCCSRPDDRAVLHWGTTMGGDGVRQVLRAAHARTQVPLAGLIVRSAQTNVVLAGWIVFAEDQFACLVEGIVDSGVACDPKPPCARPAVHGLILQALVNSSVVEH